MSAQARPFDVVVFGATGYTGTLVAKYLANRALNNNKETFSWAIAGRNKQKLEQVRTIAAGQNPECKNLQMIFADVTDQKSIDSMVAQTRVLLTTAGPYTLYGRPVVEACVRLGTHYVDLTGEVNFVKATIDEFHAKAEAKGVHIVSCCGYDSIPSDLSTLFLVEEAKRQNKVVSSVYGVEQTGTGGPSGGTIFSIMTFMGLPPAIKKEAIQPFALNPADKKPAFSWSRHLDQITPEYRGDIKRWTVPSPLAAGNSRIVRRSAALLGYSSDFSYREGMQVGKGGLVFSLLTYFVLLLAVVVLNISFLRKALHRFLPQPGTGPSDARLKAGWFRQETIGRCTDGSKIVTEMSGGEPGYLETSKMIAESALCLAKAKLSSKGGVLTPASSMGTELIHRLDAAGLKFRIIP